MDSSLAPALLVIVVLLIIFLVGREIVCWYWKINRGVELMEEILIELKKANEKSSTNK